MTSLGNASSNRSSKETITFEIVKYSRARPLLTNLVSKDKNNSGQIDWTHFNQPRLSLNADIIHTDLEDSKKSGLPRHTRKISLQIIWNSDPQSSHTSDHPSVFNLEQIDLNQIVVDFSNSRLGEMPLKAVYKDCVVGLRYAISHEAGALIYNRFQLRFHNPTDCLDFVRVIEFICPCKLSPPEQQSSQQRVTQTPFDHHSKDTFSLQSSLSILPNTKSAVPHQGPNSRLPTIFDKVKPDEFEAHERCIDSDRRPIKFQRLTLESDKVLEDLSHRPSQSCNPQLKLAAPSQHPDQQPTYENHSTQPIDLSLQHKAVASPGLESLISLPDDQFRNCIQQILHEPGFLELATRVDNLMQS
ncbi:uncharacterized protein MELLADRAFT_100971 [Melampsora larici-populina 98AG31]|uniref:Uncharacterized protein n=1 Tax=Melampsora larici-populina (strain 98AG31 / pathotype 3-4-7) TaxID=747676 RepID=F4R361_MELLP|nr:uncharacterized protein MELLADRAFT_100971 [Melampsora larici-populina 98AG31]EGG12573.1 hypothetical protein MELLADRAFT_100971 [Melampsora larici-populina 98AG31]